MLAAILHVDSTTVAWSFGLRNLIVPGEFSCLAGMPFDMARNTACAQCLQGGFEYLFFLDSDCIPPRDAVLRLLSHRKPIISGVYCRRSPPHGIPVMIKGGQWITQYTPGAILEVDFVGAGCLLIHRSVLESLPPNKMRPEHRWFHWRVDARGVVGENGLPLYPEGECLSEDFAFSLECRKQLGIPTLVDTSIVCRHVGYAQAIPGGMYPLETHPVT